MRWWLERKSEEELIRHIASRRSCDRTNDTGRKGEEETERGVCDVITTVR